MLEPGEGESYSIGASPVVLKATGADTGGSLFLSETTIAPGFPRPPLHVHAGLHDMFFVLEGTLTMPLERDAVAGTFVCVPPGCPHTWEAGAVGLGRASGEVVIIGEALAGRPSASEVAPHDRVAPPSAEVVVHQA